MSHEIAVAALRRLGLDQSHVARVRRYIRSSFRRVRDQDVDDLAQEVFERLVRMNQTELIADPLARVYLIADQVMSDYWRKPSQDSSTGVDAAAADFDIASEALSDRLEDSLLVTQELERALQVLPPLEVAVLKLRYQAGLSSREIAKVLGLSLASVEKYISTARARLRQGLAGAGSEQTASVAILPVAVFLQDGTHADEVMRALEAFLETFDLVVEHRLPPVFGSFFGRLWVRTVDRETAEELRRKLQKVERALETQQIAKPQSEVDLNHAQAVAALMNALGKESKSVAIQVGNLLCLTLVDEHGDKHARVLTLSEEQCSMIRENQHLLWEPEMILERISESNTRTGT